MAVYECKIRGTETVRIVKAATSAQARDHIVDARPISAERMADLIEGGAKLEKIADPADPASHAPGGELHKDAGAGAPESDEAGKGEEN